MFSKKSPLMSAFNQAKAASLTTKSNIDVNGIAIELIRSAKRKTLSIEVGHSGVKVRAPLRMREKTIMTFVNSKEDWIRQHISTLPVKLPALELKDGSSVMLLNQEYQLRITDGRGAIHLSSKPQFNIHGLHKPATINIPIITSHLERHQSVQRKLVKWYKQTALQDLSHRVSLHLEKMQENSPIPNLKVRDYKRRWGSCDHRGCLSFNWRIIMAPATVVDYVVIHELAHLQEFNHSRRFWKIVEQQMPDWREQQDWLSQNGRLLYRF